MTLDQKIQILHSDVDSNKLLIYRGMAAVAIRNHMNTNDTDDIIEQKYESALLQLIDNKIQSDNTNGIKSYTMSKTSVTYSEDKGFRITDDIKALLPVPYIKLMG